MSAESHDLLLSRHLLFSCPPPPPRLVEEIRDKTAVSLENDEVYMNTR